MSDIEHWKKTIEWVLRNHNRDCVLAGALSTYNHTILLCRQNCYDNFELTSCEILNESYGEGTATVQFVANMIQVDSCERTAFMETSTFERGGEHVRGGAWLYLNGEIEDPPGRKEKEIECTEEEETPVTSESSDKD